jgi:hypothetical protein
VCQPYSLAFSTVAGGGGAVSNLQYQLVETFGQPLAGGPMTGSGYSLLVGFGLPIVSSSNPPVLNIDLPSPGEIVTNSSFTASGTAIAPAGVQDVYFRLNGGAWTTVTTADQWTNWTANLTLDTGANIFSAYAMGKNGLASATNSVTFTYAPNVTPGHPTLTITAPTAGEGFTNLIITASGTAADVSGVAAVYVQDTGGGWMRALTQNAWNNWTAQVTLTPSLNTLSAYAVNNNGVASVTNSVTFSLVISNYYYKNKLYGKLLVQINGIGTITPKDNGKGLLVGSVNKITAVPGPNQIVSNWVGGIAQPYSVLTNGPTLKFVMETSLVLEVNFIPNVFLPVQGSYYGLFEPYGAPRQQTNSGAISMLLTTAGGVSGKIVIGTNSTSFSGKFSPAGVATIAVARKGAKPLTLTLNVNFAGQEISGQVTDGSFLSPLQTYRNPFSNKEPSLNYEGQYTLMIPGSDDPTVGPFGDSYGTVTVTAGGSLSFAGALGDGTSVSQTTGISQQGYWPLYLSLYNGNGSIWGWNYFNDDAIAASSPGLSWINATNPVKTALYRSGFTNQSVQIVSSGYNKLAKPLLALSAPADVFLDGGGLPGITNEITITTASALKLTSNPENTNKLTLTINRNNGVISGSFANPLKKGSTISIHGVILQNTTNAAGYFPGTNVSGAFELLPETP